MVRVFGRRLPLALRARLRMEGRHPRKPPHWYLAIMGVDPEWQGRGIGSKLMQPALETLDAEGTPAYLEASTPRSRAQYDRHGIAVTGAFNPPSGGQPLWQRRREPARR
jgi:GNAT superfamily N-acetyltransferase